jgi:sec-independent protein translocase protein TatC
MISFQFSGLLIERMKNDLLPEGALVIYVSPLEVMVLKLKMAVIIGLLCTLPLMMFFVFRAAMRQYGLKPIKINPFWLVISGISAVIMFLLGAYYAYFIMLPLFIQYLYINAAASGVVATYSIFKFISFGAEATIIFGLIFELPIVLTILTRLGIVKHIYVLFLVVGAVITPPDVISQIMVAVPMLIFFEISMIVVRILGGKRE